MPDGVQRVAGSRSITAFVTRLLQRSRALGAIASGLHQQLDAALAARGQTIEDAIRAEGQHQAAEQAGMANLIGSLRLISTFDWSEFFESVSLVEQVLQRDPAGVYSRMDFRSRDRYRHAVEELAVPTGEGQLLLALKSVERARQAHVRTPDVARVARRLSPDRRRAAAVRAQRRVAARSHAARAAALLRVRDARVPRHDRRGHRRCSSPSAVVYAWWHGWRGASLVFVALLAAVPASELVIQLLQRMISYLIPPRRLPRLELDAVPPSARTMVIVPTLLDSVERVGELIAHLEVQALGNIDPHIHFAILSDFLDAPTETLPHDAEILEAARAGIAALNAKHADGGTDRFFLFHRLRQWNEREGLWMGWERKRGKIEEFNRLLRGATDTSFAVCGRRSDACCREIKYCITLDSDTRLPRGVARELIGIITHPLNRATFNPRVGRVTEGYGILQPRISVTFMSAAGSLFARLYSGHTGVDPYTTAVSDTYQDLFGEGIFTGKGLYDVDAFTAALEGSVPENALLSHDLFEGLHARVALVSDVELVDEYPSSVLSHARRQHRWIRGDWQILFWLFPFVPSRRGLKRNTLPIIGRWKILDNLRRSLVAPTLLALLVAGWTVLPGPRWFWTMTVMGVAASQLLPVLARLLVGPGRAQSIPVFLRNLRHDAATALAQILLSLTFLAFHAFDTAHAIGVTARAPRGHEAPAAGVGNGGDHGGESGGRGRAAAAPIRGRDGGQPDHRGRRRPRHRRAGTGCASRRGAVSLPVDRSRRSSPTGSACRSAPAFGRSTIASEPCCDERRARPGAISRRSSRKPMPGWPPTTIRTTTTSEAGAPHVTDQHRHEPAVDAGRA